MVDTEPSFSGSLAENTYFVMERITTMRTNNIIEILTILFIINIIGCESSAGRSQKATNLNLKFINEVKSSPYPGETQAKVGPTLESKFDKGQWKVYDSNKGEKIVEFKGNISEKLHESAANSVASEILPNKKDYKNDEEIYFYLQIGVNLVSLTTDGQDFSSKWAEEVVGKHGCKVSYTLSGGRGFVDIDREKMQNINEEEELKIIKECSLTLVKEYLLLLWPVGAEVKFRWGMVTNEQPKLLGIECNELKGVSLDKALELIYKD